MDLKKLLGRMFKKVDDVVIDLTTGGLGVVSKDADGEAIATLVEKAGRYSLKKNPITKFGHTVPAWAIRTPVSQVQKGDLVILADNGDMFVTDIKNGGEGNIDGVQLCGIQAKTGRTTKVSTAVNLLLGQSILVVKSLGSFVKPAGDNDANLFGNMNPLFFALFGDEEKKKKGEESNKDMLMMMLLMSQQGQGNGQGGLFGGGGQSMLPLWLLLQEEGEGSSDLNGILPLLLLSGQGGLGGGLGGAGGMNPLMLMALGGGGEGSGGFDFKTLMLLQAMGGCTNNCFGGGMFGNLFGGGQGNGGQPPPATAPAPKAGQ